MAFPPTILTITYLTYSNANPAVITTATAVLNIPANSNVSDYIQAIVQRGFFTTQNTAANQPSTQTYIPPGMIASVVAS